MTAGGTEKLSSRGLSRTDRVIFPLITVATLRISLTKDAQRRRSVLTQDPRTGRWFEQNVELIYDKELGCPNPTDEEVLFGLIEASRTRQEERRFTIELDEFVELLQWRTWTWYEKRIEEALRRWQHVQFAFDKGKFRQDTATWEPDTVPTFSSLEITGGTYTVEWGETVHEGLKLVSNAFHLRDYQLFQNAIARRIYVLTHLTLAGKGRATYRLRDFAENDIGIHIGYSYGHIRTKLSRGLAELEQKGYILPSRTRFTFQLDKTALINFEAGPMFRKCTPATEAQGTINQLELGMPEPGSLLKPALPKAAKTRYPVLHAPGPAAQGATPQEVPIPARETSPIRLAESMAINMFWQSLPPDRRQAEEAIAISRANELQKELLRQDTPVSKAIRDELLRTHALVLMAAQG